jgi:hypothetical protein
MTTAIGGTPTSLTQSCHLSRIGRLASRVDAGHRQAAHRDREGVVTGHSGRLARHTHGVGSRTLGAPG